jgi:hypothetical protein
MPEQEFARLTHVEARRRRMAAAEGGAVEQRRPLEIEADGGAGDAQPIGQHVAHPRGAEIIVLVGRRAVDLDAKAGAGGLAAQRRNDVRHRIEMRRRRRGEEQQPEIDRLRADHPGQHHHEDAEEQRQPVDARGPRAGIAHPAATRGTNR